jgi:trans-aconitate 2-methyltransferase
VNYTFGDSAIASERLAIVGHVMAPAMRSVLSRVDASSVRTVIDLGCGPGHTTRRLAECFPAASVVGIDLSEAYVAEAAANAPDQCSFVVGDVGATPLPGAPADVVYARYLLSHLDDMEGYVTRWCAAVAPGGHLVLEEPEAIDSSETDFALYERVSSGLVQSAGGVFYAGPLIAAVPTPAGFERVHDDTFSIDVTEGEAAAMFWRNARAWDRDALKRAGYNADDVMTLADRLQVREHSPTRGLFDWRQRQTVFKRV